MSRVILPVIAGDDPPSHAHTQTHTHAHTLRQVLESKGLKADEWVQEVVAVIGGKGGGSANTAKAVGPNTDRLAEVLTTAKNYATSKLH